MNALGLHYAIKKPLFLALFKNNVCAITFRMQMIAFVGELKVVVLFLLSIVQVLYDASRHILAEKFLVSSKTLDFIFYPASLTRKKNKECKV